MIYKHIYGTIETKKNWEEEQWTNYGPLETNNGIMYFHKFEVFSVEDREQQQITRFLYIDGVNCILWGQ